MFGIIDAINNGNAEKPAVIDASGAYTYGEYIKHIKSIAEYLKSRKISFNDNVVIVARQSEIYLAAFHAVQYIGAIPVPLERSTNKNRITDVAQLTNAKAVITDDESVSDNVITYAALSEVEIIKSEFNPCCNEISQILFTTGTTGKSKGVVMTHKSDVAVAENVVYGVNKQSDDIELIPMPLNHSFALRRYYANMLLGSTAVLCDGVINLRHFFELIEKYKVNAIAMNPAAFDIIFKLSKNKLGEYKEQLRYVQLGSAHLSDDGKEKLVNLLPNSHLYNMYGSTEAGCSCVLDFSIHKNLSNCIGKPTVNSAFAVVDENECVFTSDKNNLGRLICSGGMCMKEYYKDEETTKSAMKNGYVFSNDLSYIDENGMIYVFGRCDDVIACSGNKINPQDVEDAAKLSGLIEDCACVPFDDEKIGTVPKLFIVPKANFSEKEMTKFLSERLEYYMVPKKYEEIKEIPKSFNGKPLRRKLRQENKQ